MAFTQQFAEPPGLLLQPGPPHFPQIPGQQYCPAQTGRPRGGLVPPLGDGEGETRAGGLVGVVDGEGGRVGGLDPPSVGYGATYISFLITGGRLPF